MFEINLFERKDSEKTQSDGFRAEYRREKCFINSIKNIFKSQYFLIKWNELNLRQTTN